jgi:AraC family transcriptional regulator
MAGLPNLANMDCLGRINRAIDHVTRNLAQPLRLDEVAKVACFSPYHFHRVFRAVVGETLHDFVKRLRLDRALYLMSHGDGMSLTDVALACGFGSSSDFSRSFRDRFGLPPSAFDLEEFRKMRRQQMVDALPEGDKLALRPVDHNPDGFQVRLRELPARRVAYLRVFRPFEGGVVETVAKLVAWAKARGLEGGQWLGWMWDEPEIVPLEQCRYDVGLEVPEGVALAPEVHEVRFEAMKVAQVYMLGGVDLETRALDWLYGVWMPPSGYMPDHHPCFEAWVGLPLAQGMERCEINVQMPVVKTSG